MRLDQLYRLLKRNKLTYSFQNIFRLAFLIQSALWSSVFSWIEQARYSVTLKNTPVPKDPIFIIGHWRTGSTLLHQLMSLDPQMTTPTLFQVAVPDSFLVSYPYYRPIFKRVISKHRPMDQVRIGMDEPQEDEYAIYRLTCYSPLENLVFPKSGSYFLNHGASFLPPDDKLEQWKKDVTGFYKKLHFKRRKRIISKNPFNSFRINVLCDMFPGARFIHIVRHPDDVIPSTINMWDILQKQNRLNKPVIPPDFRETVGVLENLLTAIENDRVHLKSGHYAEIRFEDLEVNPVDVIKSVYQKMDIPFTGEFEDKINRFMKDATDFRKNTFTLTPEEKTYIREKLQHMMNKYDYR
jgi:hypothetical protein